MTCTTEHAVAERVRQSLAARPIGQELDVLESNVRHEDDWWYVPVAPRRDIQRTDEYYNLLADVEDEMRDQEGVNVTLVPTSNILKLVPRRSTLRPMHVTSADWERLCHAASMNPLKSAYDRADCQRLAEVILANPQIIQFDPPEYSREVADFFRASDGIEPR